MESAGKKLLIEQQPLSRVPQAFAFSTAGAVLITAAVLRVR